MLKHAVSDAVHFNWTGIRARASLPCTLAVAIALGSGLAVGQPVAGLVAAGGAMSVGFGAFQRLGRSRNTPMFWASVGMSLSAAIGSLVPHTTSGLIANAFAVGLVFGLFTALGPGVTWIVLQCGIGALVATAYPTGWKNAVGRGALILAGGLLQMFVVVIFRQLHHRFSPDIPYNDSYEGVTPALRTLRGQFSWQAAPLRYATQLAVTLSLAATAARIIGLSNSYWAPMTALLVLRTQLRETFSRGIARVGGTVVGAGLATLIASGLRPGPVSLGLLVLLFAWLCYSVVNVNYGVFSVCVTAYIAFLLAFAGLPEKAVAFARLANTALGGTLALAVAAPGFLLHRRACRRSEEAAAPARRS